MHNASATDNFVYALRFLRSDNTAVSIARIDKSALTVTASFDLTNIGAQCAYAVNDDLIYVFTAGALYYIKNFSEIIYIGSFAATPWPFSNTGFFTNSAFYYGGDGFAGLSPHIYRTPVACPEAAPIIASVTTGGGSPPTKSPWVTI